MSRMIISETHSIIFQSCFIILIEMSKIDKASDGGLMVFETMFLLSIISGQHSDSDSDLNPAGLGPFCYLVLPWAFGERAGKNFPEMSSRLILRHSMFCLFFESYNIVETKMAAESNELFFSVQLIQIFKWMSCC